MISGEIKEDGILFDESKCPMPLCQSLLRSHFKFDSSYFDNKTPLSCFCLKCHKQRKDENTYKRGKPPSIYVLPVGWVRFNLSVPQYKVNEHKIFDEWHVSYHGTGEYGVRGIFRSGLTLLKPGDVALGGEELKEQNDHISKPFKRINKFTNAEETFDKNQIFTSPSIAYASLSTYAKPFYISDPNDKNITYQLQFVFQLRQRPGSYNIGQETVGAAVSGIKLDKYVDNNEIEWYTKENVAIVLTGLLLRIKKVE